MMTELAVFATLSGVQSDPSPKGVAGCAQNLNDDAPTFALVCKFSVRFGTLLPWPYLLLLLFPLTEPEI
jgi:hypothetical protein